MLYDKDIREPLFEFLEESYGKIRILEEQVMGQSRADIVMVVPDALYGIEIKSDEIPFRAFCQSPEEMALAALEILKYVS